MKTQVIQVEAHDDVVSLRDKLSWVKARRVLLVYPRRGAALDTRLAWLLLRRQAEAMGASLGVVAHAAQTCRLAQEAGIPVFSSVLEAQQAEWPAAPRGRIKRRSQRPNLAALRVEVHREEGTGVSRPWLRLVVFSLAVLALLILLLFLLPSAEIRLSPVLLFQTVSFEGRAVSVVEQRPSASEFPLHLASVVVEGDTTWPVSGQIPLPTAHARGIVRFRNLTDRVVGIPAGTVVRTVGADPVRFVTLEDAVLAAGVDSLVDVPARAELPGASGNLPANVLAVVDGPLGASLTVTNPYPMHGGSERLVPAPSVWDRRQARTVLLTELRHRALTALQQQAGADDVLIPSTLEVVEVVEESSLPTEGQPGDALWLSLKVEFSVRYLRGEDLKPRARAALDAVMPAGFVPLEETLTVQPVEATWAEDGTLTCRFLVRRALRQQIAGFHLAHLVRGRPVATASSWLLSHLPLRSAPQIRLHPSWWPWLPFNEFRIAIHPEG